MPNFGIIDWIILGVYFCLLASIGPLFARKNKSTETFFTGNREFPSWLLGLAMFATSISSVTVVAYPADAYKTGYLRLLAVLMLPVSIYISSKVFLPYFRRNRCTSAFEFLEGRFGPGVRLYAACAFLLGQLLRISMILYLVSLVFQQITGATPYVCVLIGGLVIGTYAVMGGMRAIVWTQFAQAFVLWCSAFLVFATVVGRVEGGIAEIIKTAMSDGKFMLGDLNTATGRMEPAPWFSLHNKAILMMLLFGLIEFTGEYSSNQNVIQKYVSAKNPVEATRSIWLCCCFSIPTWTFFMFLGTSLYVFFKQNPDPQAAAILAGAEGMDAESILPYFCVTNIPTGLLGLVIAGILSAAMSASASSVNAISAVVLTDIYRHRFAPKRDERHYVTVARVVSALSVLAMVVGASLLLSANKLTLLDTSKKLTAILGGGLVGLYVLGFATRRGTSRTVAIAILCTVAFSAYMAAIEMNWISADTLARTLHLPVTVTTWFIPPIHTYYVGIFGNIIMFVVAYSVARLFERKRDDLGKLTLWRQWSDTTE